MNVEILKKAEQLAAKAGHVFVATADAKGGLILPLRAGWLLHQRST